MNKIIDIYIFVEVAVLILAIISYIFWNNRYRKNHGSVIPNGFEKTEEVTIDPTTNKKLRVYYNPTTGERFYQEDND